jgi:hypothetical protein
MFRCEITEKRSLMKELCSVKRQKIDVESGTCRASGAALHNKKILGEARLSPAAGRLLKWRRPVGESRGTGSSSAECLRFGLCLHKARPQTIRLPPRAVTRLGTAKQQRDSGQFLPRAPPQPTEQQVLPSVLAPRISPFAWPQLPAPPSSWRVSSQLFSWRPSGPPFSLRASSCVKPASSSLASSCLPLCVFQPSSSWPSWRAFSSQLVSLFSSLPCLHSFQS